MDISTITYINTETILMVSKKSFENSGSKYVDVYRLFLIRFHHKMAESQKLLKMNSKTS